MSRNISPTVKIKSILLDAPNRKLHNAHPHVYILIFYFFYTFVHILESETVQKIGVFNGPSQFVTTKNLKALRKGDSWHNVTICRTKKIKMMMMMVVMELFWV